jgi:hypothetical protein
MIKRKVYNIDEVDTTVPTGGIVSISPYHSHPYTTNKLEMLAMGIFIEKYMPGYQVHMHIGCSMNHEDVCYRNALGQQVVIDRDHADYLFVSHAVIPYRVAVTTDRTAFAKNFVIVDKSISTIDHILVPAIDVGADPRFIPIRAESILGNDLLIALCSL